MAQQSLAIRIGNPLMKFILRSPLHKIASASIMLITVTGRRSGKQYTTPVNYIEDEEAGILTVLTHKHRTWWRNLRGDAPVSVVLRGEKLMGTGYLFDEGQELVDRFYDYLCTEPRLAPHLGVELDGDVPNRASAEAAAKGKVMVEIWLEGDYELVEDELVEGKLAEGNEEQG